MGDPWQGIAGGRSLHDWLVDSSFVKAGDKQHRGPRRKSSRARGEEDHIFAGPSLTHVAPRHGDVGYVAPAAAPGKRKVRRWMNERLLREMAGPLDAASIGALYAPPPWGEKSQRSMLERVTTVDLGLTKDMTRWEPFRSVDMDVQSQMLSSQRVERRRQESAAMVAWKSVEHSARWALRRSADWPLLIDLEDKLLAFQQTPPGNEIAGGELLLELDTAYQRLLLHGLCQFHGLAASTLEEVESVETTSSIYVMAVHKRKRAELEGGACGPGSEPPRLTEFLALAKQGPPASHS